MQKIDILMNLKDSQTVNNNITLYPLYPLFILKEISRFQEYFKQV